MRCMNCVLSSWIRVFAPLDPAPTLVRASFRVSMARFSSSIRACCTSATSCSASTRASRSRRSGLGKRGRSGFRTSFEGTESDLVSVAGAVSAGLASTATGVDATAVSRTGDSSWELMVRTEMFAKGVDRKIYRRRRARRWEATGRRDGDGR